MATLNIAVTSPGFAAMNESKLFPCVCVGDGEKAELPFPRRRLFSCGQTRLERSEGFRTSAVQLRTNTIYLPFNTDPLAQNYTTVLLSLR